MLFIVGRIFIVPIKWVLKLIVNSALGGILIWIINMVGGVWGFHIGLNVYTSILVRCFRGAWSYFFDYGEAYVDVNKKTRGSNFFKLHPLFARVRYRCG